MLNRISIALAAMLIAASGMTHTLPAATVAASPAPAPPVPAGEAIYRNGLLPSGQPLVGRREDGSPVSGAAAACSNCHRRSGLGEIEGTITIPPISGPYPFRPRAATRADLDVPYVDGLRVDRNPFTPESLARAIRDGVGADGAPLGYLMPRYVLSDTEMKALIDYLGEMKPLQARGVTGAVVNFATIVTPDADPVQREAMLAVLNRYFADQNAFALAQSPPRQQSAALMSNAQRRWQLHVWQLTGAPETWDEQLAAHLEAEPVYAAIAGLGGSHWLPVHRFCERNRLPCLFPNVDLPVVAEQDVYSLYFSRGVLLEADLIAEQIAGGHHTSADGRSGGARIVQVFRPDDIGKFGAEALGTALSSAGVRSVERPIGSGGAAGLADALRGVRASDTLILWLRPDDAVRLAHMPVRAPRVFASGLMMGLENASLPSDWRAVTHMAYPAELPDKRFIGVQFALGWMVHHHIPLKDARIQVDTYVTCGLLMATLSHMAGSFTADYLVERIEGALEHELISGYYPALALAPHERFASKGGYMVHFAQSSGAKLVPETDWHVPGVGVRSPLQVALP
jgi:cytochrome c553